MPVSPAVLFKGLVTSVQNGGPKSECSGTLRYVSLRTLLAQWVVHYGGDGAKSYSI